MRHKQATQQEIYELLDFVGAMMFGKSFAECAEDEQAMLTEEVEDIV